MPGPVMDAHVLPDSAAAPDNKVCRDTKPAEVGKLWFGTTQEPAHKEVIDLRSTEYSCRQAYAVNDQQTGSGLVRAIVEVGALGMVEPAL